MVKWNRISAWKKRNYFYVCSLLAVSLFTSIPELISSFNGKWGSDEFGIFRVVREGILCLLVAETFYTFLFIKKGKAKKRSFAIFLFTLFYLVITSERSLLGAGKPLWLVMGLRPIALLLIIYTICDLQLEGQQFHNLSKIFKAFLLFQFPICVFQLLYFPPIKGATFMGPRVFGTFPNPILLSQAVCAFFLFIYLWDKRGGWIYWGIACLVLSIMSGGRSGMIGIASIFCYEMFQCVKNRYAKILTLLLSFAMVVGSYSVFSSSAFSGRDIDTFSKERRLENWGILITDLVDSGYDNLLLGEFVGSGSNLLVSYAKKTGLNELSEDRLPTDSMFLYIILSFGIFGLLIFMLILLYLFSRISGKSKYLTCFLFLWLGTSQNILEIYPVNLIFVVLFGLSLAEKGSKQDERNYGSRHLTNGKKYLPCTN